MAFFSLPSFILFLMILLFSNPANPFAQGGSLPSREEGLENECAKAEDLIQGQVPQHCRCENPNINPKDVKPCVNCTKQCRSSLKNATACNNINPTDCESSCVEPSFSFNQEGTAFSNAIQRCTTDNEQRLKQDLLNQCNQIIKDLNERKGAELVCPGGCDLFCSNQVARVEKCGEDVITSDGSKQCLQRFSQQIASNLPSDPNNLPGGFTWKHKNEKCDLGQECELSIEIAFNNSLKICKQLKKKAELCCKDPLKCIEGGGIRKRLFTNVGPLEGGDISAQCLLLKQKLTSAGNLGHQLAGQCRRRASSCVSGCNSQMEGEFLSLFETYCAFDLKVASAYNPRIHTCSEELISKYSGLYTQNYLIIPQACEQEGNKSQKMSQNAEEILKSALSAAKCVEEARGHTTGTPDGRASDNREASPPNQIGNTKAGVTFQVHGVPEKVNMHGAPKGSGVVDDSSFGRRPGANTGGGGGGKESSSSSSAFSSSKNSKDSMFREVGSSNAGKSGTGAVYGGGPVLGGASHLLKGNRASLDTKRENQRAKSPDKKEGKEGKDKEALREFAKTGEGSGKDSYSFWKKLPSRELPNNKISSYGSPHDDIFKRISNRFDFLCRTEKISCMPQE